MSDTFTFLSYPQRSILVYAAGYSRTKNMPFNTTRKTIYKGVDSTLGFDIKNQDRKSINLLDKDVMINIMRVKSGELVVQRRATKVQPESGFCEVTIFGSDISDLDPGLYQLSAVIYGADGIAESLYTDNNRRAAMELEICDGAYPKFIPSIDLVFSPTNNAFISQPVASNLQKNGANFHTIQLSVTNFTGIVEAFISLEYDSVNGMYFAKKFIDDSMQITFNNTTGTQGWNFIGDARWVKIKYTPDPSNTGTVDKVSYRS